MTTFNDVCLRPDCCERERQVVVLQQALDTMHGRWANIAVAPVMGRSRLTTFDDGVVLPTAPSPNDDWPEFCVGYNEVVGDATEALAYLDSIRKSDSSEEQRYADMVEFTRAWAAKERAGVNVADARALYKESLAARKEQSLGDATDVMLEVLIVHVGDSG